MLEYAEALFAQSNFTITVAVLAAAGCAYAVGNFLSSWLHMVCLFPGLLLGTLTAIDIGNRFGLLVGREKDQKILIVGVSGLVLALLLHFIVYDLFTWLLSYNRRAHRELVERSGDRQ